MIHELKIRLSQFSAIESGKKKFEWRKNDRDFQVGDTLILKEWDSLDKEYTGHKLTFKVTWIVCGPDFGIPEGYCIMSIELKKAR